MELAKNELNATGKVIQKLESKEITRQELAEYLDISRPTLNERLNKENWKRGELELIRKL